jgi:sterol desaturase/sphingolipid hydroxylase (fatty acid hydroxylase superfamily)
LYRYAPYADGGWLNVKNFLNYFFGYPGYLWPWTVIYVSVVVMTYTYAFPALENCKTFEAGWIMFVALRNLLLIWIFAGGWHMLLYTLKLQGKDGMDQKYDRKWPDANANKFMFGHQTYENVFVSCTSGVAVWTAYEVLFMNMWANDKISTVYYDFWGDSFADGAYSCLLILATPIWREFHFYWIHRFSHWKPFYKRVHYLHHKNTNPGPWSGLSMHPIEHILYFSVVIPHMFIPCHPIHFLFNSQHTALTPAGGHRGC